MEPITMRNAQNGEAGFKDFNSRFRLFLVLTCSIMVSLERNSMAIRFKFCALVMMIHLMGQAGVSVQKPLNFPGAELV